MRVENLRPVRTRARSRHEKPHDNGTTGARKRRPANARNEGRPRVASACHLASSRASHGTARGGFILNRHTNTNTPPSSSTSACAPLHHSAFSMCACVCINARVVCSSARAQHDVGRARAAMRARAFACVRRARP